MLAGWRVLPKADAAPRARASHEEIACRDAGLFQLF